MTLSDYYQVLGLPSGSSPDEIKKAYRQKARLYHPDINPDPEAKNKFIQATEAYEFLIANYDKVSNNEEAYRQAMEDWRKYRQDRSRQRARAYAQTSYVRFKNTKFYRSTRILDVTTIIFSLAVSILVILYTIYGYLYRLKHPMPELHQPTFLVFLMLLSLGMVFFVVSIIYLKAWMETSKKNKKNPG
ncbi:MAG: DnaJ domain-containing protein [Bacteroidales bacterium]|jgi:hypothetical protein|nr:DnaJ domain-containing protein [Bacteroidales bacterium]